jgi:hypothetical protein
LPGPVETRRPLYEYAVNGAEVDVHKTSAENALVTVPETTTVTMTDRAFEERVASTLFTAVSALHVPAAAMGVVIVVADGVGCGIVDLCA